MADKLGLALDVQVTSWENWPLKTQSGDFEAVFSNVGINKDRVKLFDFSTYRAAYMGFEAKKSSTYNIKGADDISGLKVSVGRAPTRRRSSWPGTRTWNPAARRRQPCSTTPPTPTPSLRSPPAGQT